ncbi:conserved hypothetical protein [Shewanella halifaxensis HAW-EB4]|uniref:Uncharacterized protein n=1 Tax=Shewanella halifaxensis (strain HAW-EB4) TaxID=458817 RepID=B0TR59_SHEHH|nr:hypothetical protein [Shewanella halifaxensis]ABZ77790.1 conserved hypothetical protein [Shewanella halifaxensis HAW-EB4]
MKTSAYLDAMSIVRWKKAVPPFEVLTVLVNPLRIKDVDSPIISTVLGLLGVDLAHCRFAVRVEPGTKVIWDMRGKQAVVNDNTLVSAPINELENNAEAKKTLWLNMQPFMAQKDA